MKIIIFDFEVFKYDVLLGAIVLEPGKEKRYFQTWSPAEIYDFYQKNLNSIWVGHNNQGYDNFILQAIVKNKNPYLISKEIISGDRKKYLSIPLYYYDIINTHFTSLKAVEAQMGKNISETQVDFDLDRKLTSEEKLKEESYNRDDLDQTLEDFMLCRDEFQLRIDMIKEFHLGLDALHITECQVAERVLKPIVKDPQELKPLKPKFYDNLLIKNKDALDYYLNEKWEYIPKISLNICGVPHIMAKGGLHGARKNYHTDWAYYFDVSGYYNLVMILYDLLPRTLTKEGKELYNHMYQEQLLLKKTNPRKRGCYKKICLAVYGAELNEYCKFYDPSAGRLVTLTGQIFIIDLIEKLEGKIELIQTNTDGIIAKPLNGVKEEDVLLIIERWKKRTGFELKPVKIYDIHQRDVNNYMYRDENGKIHVKGEAVKYYNLWDNPFVEDSFNSKEPYIIHHAIVEYFMNGVKPEETIERNKDNLRMFQYICKKLSYDYLSYEVYDLEGNKPTVILQNVNRIFAYKNRMERGMVYKNKEGKHDKYSNLPPNVFVYNDDIRNSPINVKEKIDYNYYVRRAYERIEEFMPKPEQMTLCI